ncbi:hypothetical protein Gorai_013735 [Gossypium raimondii]|uniref:Uncharacterized protein n=1 Tax=Gossypium raimondii TaxID=29730 RepID=A0A7J8Q5W1_GOSRA|nr:hypothetical protein [Gossypium raimondii]
MCLPKELSSLGANLQSDRRKGCNWQSHFAQCAVFAKLISDKLSPFDMLCCSSSTGEIIS